MNGRTAQCPKCNKEDVPRKDCYPTSTSVVEAFICDCGHLFNHVWSRGSWSDGATEQPLVVNGMFTDTRF